MKLDYIYPKTCIGTFDLGYDLLTGSGEISGSGSTEDFTEVTEYVWN